MQTITNQLETSSNFHFNPAYAKAYGTKEAVMLESLLFFIKKNKSLGHNLRDGRTWTCNSQREFAIIFNFWSIKQVSRILKSLIDQEVLIKANYNKSKRNRTTWYAFKDESKWLKTDV